MLNITYFVHGTTIDNEQGLASGWADSELSELGIKQAKELGNLVQDKSFDIVFCSDLKRAIDSANLVFGNKYKIVIDPRLREINYGDYTQKSENFKNNLTNFIDSPFPNGESYQDVEKRIKNLLEEISRKYPNQRVAVMAHQAPQLALEVIINHKTWPEAIAEDWRNTKSWQPGWNYSC